jgi:hypothetical protein
MGIRIPDARPVAAVDRVTFNARILGTGSKPYRLRTSKSPRRRAG